MARCAWPPADRGRCCLSLEAVIDGHSLCSLLDRESPHIIYLQSLSAKQANHLLNICNRTAVLNYCQLAYYLCNLACFTVLGIGYFGNVTVIACKLEIGSLACFLKTCYIGYRMLVHSRMKTDAGGIMG